MALHKLFSVVEAEAILGKNDKHATKVQRQSLFDNQNLLEVLFCSRNQISKANALHKPSEKNCNIPLLI